MKNLFKLISVVVIIILNISCTRNNNQSPVVASSYNTSQLNNLILKEINTSKIVMFGDCYHGHGAVYRKLIDFLNYWLDSLENCQITSEIKVPQKLVLYLEKSEEEMDHINYYFENDNLKPYLYHWYKNVIGWGGYEKFTIDKIEFLYDLKEVKQRVYSIRTRYNTDIDFQILGAEGIPPYNLETDTRENLKKIKDKYLIKERDRISSCNIIEFINSNPDYKALVFYGDAHLIRGKVNKTRWTENKKKMKGYFLAHYLDKNFNRNHVKVFTTKGVEDTNAVIFKYQTKKETPDYFVPIALVPRYPCSIYMIKNKMNMQIQYDLFKEFAVKIKSIDLNDYKWNYFSNFFGQISASHIIAESQFYEQMKILYEACQRKDSINEIINDYKVLGKEMLDCFDAIENINRVCEWISYKDVGSLCKPHLDKILCNLPNYQKIENNSNDTISNLLNINKYLLDDFVEEIALNQNGLKTYLLINLLWISDKNEKNKAIVELNQLTGHDYKTPKEWSNFWRKKYYNIN